MKQHLHWLPFPSATALILAFFLPWFSISCKDILTQQEHKIAFSGYNFASGQMPPLIESMLQLQEKLAGFGQLMVNFFQKKAKPVSAPTNTNPMAVLRRGFPSFWFALASFSIAALLGLWFALFGPTLWLRWAGTLALLIGVFCLCYPALNRPPNLEIPRQKIQFLSVRLEYGGYLLLSGLIASLFGFWFTPSRQHLPTLSAQELTEALPTEPTEGKVTRGAVERPDLDDSPPILGSWRNIYILNMVIFVMMVVIFAILTRMYT